jgi:undecaprenol kinase
MPDYKDIEPVKYDRKTHNVSFKHAFNGIMLAFRTQPNFRFHFIFFILVNTASYIYNITLSEYLSILVISAIIFSAEMINTAVEAIGDEIADDKYMKLIGVAKDVAAGAVLIAVLFAILIGSIIFIPRFINILAQQF